MAKVSFLHHGVLKCDSRGQQHTIIDHDITLRIPEGAVVEGKTIHFEIGVVMYGSFVFPEKTRPISPVVWLCILEEDAELKKSFQIILPHFLTGLTNDRLKYHQIEFCKANHSSLCKRNKPRYLFQSENNKPLLVSGRDTGYGMIESSHCCFYCLLANDTMTLAEDTSYCLVRIERTLSKTRSEICFSAVVFLKACLEV